MNPVLTLPPSYKVKIHFNIILQSVPTPSKCLIPSSFFFLPEPCMNFPLPLPPPLLVAFLGHDFLFFSSFVVQRPSFTPCTKLPVVLHPISAWYYRSEFQIHCSCKWYIRHWLHSKNTVNFCEQTINFSTFTTKSYKNVLISFVLSVSPPSVCPHRTTHEPPKPFSYKLRHGGLLRIFSTYKSTSFG